MADLPTTYSTGTVSVGANSTTVTGVGTAWATSGIRAGDMLLLNGLQVRIATVVSNTQLTLSRGWPGSAVSAGNYDILLIDDGVRSLVASNNLLQALLGNGSLGALGGLIGEANKLPYFQGAGSMALTTLTPAARALLDDTTVATMRNTLGVAYESGSNANGSYVRLADGTQICHARLTSLGPVDIANGALYRSQRIVWTYPVPFAEAPVVQITGFRDHVDPPTPLVSLSDGYATTQAFWLVTPNSTTGSSFKASCFAIGRKP